MSKRRLAVGAIALALISFVGIPTVEASPVTQHTTVFATDVAYAGLGGMRGTDGSGTISLSGVTGTVTQALLYWHGPTDSVDPNVLATVSFNGNGVTGTNIGVSSSNCWDFENSQAYRADVTALVSGNGSYTLANFVNQSADINGVSLVVFFDDGNAANNRDVVIFDGNDSNEAFDGPPVDPAGWDVALAGINYTSGEASLDMIVADGQSFNDDAVSLNGNPIVPAGAVFQGDTVTNQDATSVSDNEGGLWDIRSFSATAALTPGTNTLQLTTGITDDCLSLIVAAVNLPAGSAPNQPTTTTTTEETTTTTAAPQTTSVAPKFTG